MIHSQPTFHAIQGDDTPPGKTGSPDFFFRVRLYQRAFWQPLDHITRRGVP